MKEKNQKTLNNKGGGSRGFTSTKNRGGGSRGIDIRKIHYKTRTEKKEEKKQNEFLEAVTKALTAGKQNISPETGLRYEAPLKEEHPGLVAALAVAQPGTIVEKLLTPFMAKGTIEGLKRGEGAQALLPMTSIAKPITSVEKTTKSITSAPKSTLSEAERLGIPKGERSNPQALEDPYYWGYQQWNDRYNAAVNSGNLQEAQKLRDLHFKIKAPDTKVVDENGIPLHTYHGFLPRRGVFTKFKGVNFGVERTVKEGNKANHWKLSIPNEHRMTSYHTPNYDHALTPYASGNPDNVYDDYLYIKKPFTWNEENLHNILLNSGHTSEKIPFSEPGHFRKIAARDSNGKLLKDENGSIIFKDSDIWIPEKSGFRYPQVSDWADFRGNPKTELMKRGYDGLYIPQYYDSYGAFVSPSQFKSAEPITRTDLGEIIPIVKRDNFHNLDRRYKQGGSF